MVLPSNRHTYRAPPTTERYHGGLSALTRIAILLSSQPVWILFSRYSVACTDGKLESKLHKEIKSIMYRRLFTMEVIIHSRDLLCNQHLCVSLHGSESLSAQVPYWLWPKIQIPQMQKHDLQQKNTEFNQNHQEIPRTNKKSCYVTYQTVNQKIHELLLQTEN